MADDKSPIDFSHIDQTIDELYAPQKPMTEEEYKRSFKRLLIELPAGHAALEVPPGSATIAARTPAIKNGGKGGNGIV